MFKRHLISVHCQQGSSRNKKSSSSSTQSSVTSVAGLCSTCRNVFPSAQALLAHLDECVLRVVQQPSAISENNERLLSGMTDTGSSFVANNDNDPLLEGTPDIHQTIQHNPRSGKGTTSSKSSSSSSSPLLRANVVDGRVTKRTTTTPAAPKPLQRRAYPAAWSLPADEVNLKTRVTCVFDGQRRLFKDEMAMNTDYEVDLDLVSLSQADFMANASEEEMMRWVGVPPF